MEINPKHRKRNKMYGNMKKIFFLGVVVFTSCITAGNRQPDLNLSVVSYINDFYIRKQAKKEKKEYSDKWYPINSELAIFPEQFFLIRDTFQHLYYSIEGSSDSINSIDSYVSLNSVYDVDKRCWITDVKTFELYYKSKFLRFMNEYYLPKIIEENKNVHDTIFYDKEVSRVRFTSDFQ